MKVISKISLAVGMALLGSFMLIGCGSSSDSSNAPSSSTLTGTAAVGNALSNVPVYLKDSSSPGKVVVAQTDAEGNFSFYTSNLTAPFYMRTQGYGLFSYSAAKTGVANITPLTTAVVELANGGDADIYTTPPLQLDVNSYSTSLQTALANVMTHNGVSGKNFITSSFVANGTGIDAIIDTLYITVDGLSKSITITDPFTGSTLGAGTFSSGSVSLSDSIDASEAGNLSTTVTSKKYFGTVQDNYGNPKDGPRMIDITDRGDGNLSVKVTAIYGDTGKLFLVYGHGTKNGSNVTLTLPLIMCQANTSDGNGTAVITATIGADGTLTGTFTNTLSTGDKCNENNSSIYKGDINGQDVTNATPVTIAGNYGFYNRHGGESVEDGPHPVTFTQSGSTLGVSTTITDPTTQTRTGSGTVYGNYTVFTLPVIMCNDTGINGVYPDADYATFFGEYNATSKTMSGIFGDGLPIGDTCQDKNNANAQISATGTWSAVKQ